MTKKKITKIKPYTKHWESLANETARTWINIYPCKHCGYPVVYGYCCDHCGSHNPGSENY